jgi:predicted SAM-dependent methyltransferase
MNRKLHIGGIVPKSGWEILNSVTGPYVDHVCNANDLSTFESCSFSTIYASHIVEHLDYQDELLHTLKEWNRVLQHGGRLFVSVPDMDILARLFLDKNLLSTDERFFVMRMIFGGHMDQYDYHVVGLNQEFLEGYMLNAGFKQIEKVNEFMIFDDTSSMKYKGELISLNLIATKPKPVIMV